MKTLIKNTATGFIIGGILIVIVSGITGMDKQVLSGTILLICSAITKAFVS